MSQTSIEEKILYYETNPSIVHKILDSDDGFRVIQFSKTEVKIISFYNLVRNLRPFEPPTRLSFFNFVLVLIFLMDTIYRTLFSNALNSNIIIII